MNTEDYIRAASELLDKIDYKQNKRNEVHENISYLKEKIEKEEKVKKVLDFEITDLIVKYDKHMVELSDILEGG